jgi:Fic family protein
LSDEKVGVYKTKMNRIVDSKGVTIYTPPPSSKARELTVSLLHWLNSKAAADLHPMIVSAIAHHRLVSIHPFSDGNGRVSRSLALWILYSRLFDERHLFSLDDFFEQNRRRYYEKIQQARDLDDDLTSWLEYVAGGLLETLKTTKDRISSLKIKSKTKRLTISKRQEDVLRFLSDRAEAKSPDIEKAFSISRARVNQLLKPLVDAGIVDRQGRTRATAYRLSK